MTASVRARAASWRRRGRYRRVRELRAERVYAQGLGRSLRDPRVAGVTRVDQGGDPLGVGNRGLEQLQPLPRYLRSDEKGQAGEIAAWVRETGDQPGSAKGYPDDRERRGRLFGRINHRRPRGDEDLRAEPRQVGSEIGKTLHLSVGMTDLDLDLARRLANWI
jgi:hypothetical protein